MNARDMAQAAGLPPRLAYGVADTARYTGVSDKVLRREMHAGRLSYVLPRSAKRGALIRPEAIDLWVGEGGRGQD